MEQNTRIIDVREHVEFANGHIAGSHCIPLGSLPEAASSWDRKAAFLLVCKSGRRAQQAHDQLSALGFHNLSVLPGGIEAWAAAGNPVQQLERRPWSMERQVRFVAGSLVLLTMALAFAISRYFLVLTGLVGAGLVFAGASDICMMASLLGHLPWNRPASAAATQRAA